MVSIAIGDYLEYILSWIKLQWKNAIPLRRVYIAFAGVIGFALFILFCILYSQLFLVPLGLSTLELSDIDSGFALAFLGTVTGGVALFSGFLAILRSDELKRTNDIAIQTNKIADKQNKVTAEKNKVALKETEVTKKQASIAEKQARTAERQAYTAEQVLITDRLNKATEGLGKSHQNNKPMLEIRLGALFSLERIAQDSIEDHIRIMKIICAYIYVRNPLVNSRSKAQAISEDVRAALIIIGQRGEWTEDQKHLKEEEKQKYRLDFRHCNLRNAGLNNANLRNADLINTTLEISVLTDADFSDAHLQNTNLTKANLTRTNFKNAYMGASWAYEGNFSRCLNLTQKQLEHMYCGSEIKVKIPNNLTRPLHWPTDDLTREEFIESYEKWLKDIGY